MMSDPTLVLALVLTKLFLCFAVFLQHLENLKLVNRPRYTKSIFAPTPYRAILLAALIACTLWPVILLLAGPSGGFLWAEVLCSLVIAFSLLTVSISFGGSFNGGADSMSLQVALALVVALSTRFFCDQGWLGSGARLLGQASVLYIGVQLILSYFVAGLVKLRNPAWRNGQALRELVQMGHYEVSSSALNILQSKTWSKVLGWSVILLEVLFPLFFMNPQTAILGLTLAFLFHLANFWILGLNRFVWAWLAAYPAAWYLSHIA